MADILEYDQEEEGAQVYNAQPEEVKHYLDDYFEHFDCADCIKVDNCPKKKSGGVCKFSGQRITN